MKRNLLLKSSAGSVLLGASSLLAGNFTNVIEMVEVGTGDDEPLIWRMPGNVPDEGYGFLVGEPVPEGGAIFILSTIQAEPVFIDWYLDQVAVGGYLPQVEMSVKTHDIEAPVPRVRADRPIELEISVSGLYEEGSPIIDESTIQEAAQQVRLQLFAEEYAPGTNSLAGGEVNSPAHTELVLEGNGDFPQNEGELTFYTSLNPDRPEKARGEERFVVRSLADGGFEGAALEEVGVQVWPVWSGKMSGLDEPTFLPYQFTGSLGQQIALPQEPVYPREDFDAAPDKITYNGAPPEINFTWRDVYPSSTIGIIVNDAAKPYPWGGSWVGGTKRVFNEDGSLDHSLTVKDWGKVFSGPGRYAIWMVTHTPGIGWEVGGEYDSSGNLIPGGWIVPIARPAIEVRASIMSLNE